MKQKSKFVHKVSKGSRYNQIYIPKEKEFEVGDIVEVRLIKRKSMLYYSEHLTKLSKFKESLIKQIFSFLSKYKEVKQIFVFGSFLTKKIGYNDIDMLILVDKEKSTLEKRINEDLTEEFNLRFHIILSEEDKNSESLKISPITRSMLYYFVSDKEFHVSKETKINENHIRSLLMMSEDLLRVKMPLGRVYYDSLRKLVTIVAFLKNNEIAPDKIDSELSRTMVHEKLNLLKENHNIEPYLLKEVRKIIKDKLSIIYNLLKDGKK